MFREAALAGVHPEGWLRRYLEVQRDGLTGHLEHAGFPFDTGGWLATHVQHRDGESWWPYEQTAYWIDGMARCGYLLRDRGLIAKAERPMDHVLRRPDKDGYLGPESLKPADRKLVRWPHAVFFRAFMARHSATGDPALVKAIARHYLSGTSPHNDRRDVCNVEPMLWAYEHNGDRRLLKMAEKAFGEFDAKGNRWYPTLRELRSRKAPTHHGVTYNEVAKLGAILYLHTGRRDLLQAAINGYRKLDQHAMLASGVHSSAEHIGGCAALDSHETCDIADYTWSCGYLLMATGAAEYADKIEKACFNAAPGAVRADFKGLQYFSCPNQVVADVRSNHNAFHRGSQWMSYRPNPGTECCPGAVNRIMPNYAARMWMHAHEGGGPVAALYGPSRFDFTVGGQAVHIVEETTYPFGERIDFMVRCAAPARFGLTLRIPGWCRAARVQINGVPWKRALKAGSFVTLHREFQPNDRVSLFLPMSLRLRTWPEGGVSIERGPLVYALKIDEDWQRDPHEKKCSREFPAWNLYPASPWNYALDLGPADPFRDVEILHHPMSPEPWSHATAPVELRVPARRVRGWNMIRKRRERVFTGMVDGKAVYGPMAGRFLFTPPLPDPDKLAGRLGKREWVRLVPYGCTRLRVTVFPVVG
jgi:DUF1680 family protein